MSAPPIRRWLVDAALRIEAALGPARVRRVVLPQPVEHPGKEDEFCAVQLDDGSVGLAFALLDGTLAALEARAPERELRGRPAIDLVRGYAEGDAADRVLGLAAINALTRRLYERAGFVPDASTDLFASLGLGTGDRLGMVGHFAPLVSAARAFGIPVTVIELRADLVREEPGLVVTLDAGRLAGCNKIVSTSTLLLNDTFESIAACWRGAESVAVLGPSAGGPPDPLFGAGVSSVGTVWIGDGDAFVARCAARERWGDAARKVTLTPARHRAFDALLARAR